MAKVDNYFLILGLGDYKPAPNFVDTSVIGTTDEDAAIVKKIKDAIDTKRLEWTKGQIDPRNSAKYKHYIELIPTMESELQSLETRKNMYNDAKAQVAQMLKRPLGNIVVKGYVYTEELERIAKQCNISLETVRNFHSAE